MNNYTPLPKKDSLIYTKIKDLTDNKYFNIYCTVTGVYDWTKSKGGDFVMTLKVKDDTSDMDIFIKIFSPVKIFDHKFYKEDYLRVNNIKHYRLNFYIISKESDIEVLYSKVRNILNDQNKLIKNDQDKYIKNNNTFIKNDNNKLIKNDQTNINQNNNKLIKDLKYSEYIKFIGKLVNIQKESDNLYILAFIDNTINLNINKSENRGFYENNMVLYVRVWDKITKKISEMEINKIYLLENLKIKLEINKMLGDLSDTPLTKIVEIKDKEIIKSIEERENKEKESIISFSEHIYNSNILKDINLINQTGYFKIRIKIVRHYPYKGKYYKICKLCKVVEEEDIFKCECGGVPDKIFIVKYLVKDDSGENVLICKNEVGRTMLQRCTNYKIYELLIYAEKKNEKIYLEVKDIPNFI